MILNIRVGLSERRYRLSTCDLTQKIFKISTFEDWIQKEDFRFCKTKMLLRNETDNLLSQDNGFLMPCVCDSNYKAR